MRKMEQSTHQAQPRAPPAHGTQSNILYAYINIHLYLFPQHMLRSPFLLAVSVLVVIVGFPLFGYYSFREF